MVMLTLASISLSRSLATDRSVVKESAKRSEDIRYSLHKLCNGFPPAAADGLEKEGGLFGGFLSVSEAALAELLEDEDRCGLFAEVERLDSEVDREGGDSSPIPKCRASSATKSLFSTQFAMERFLKEH